MFMFYSKKVKLCTSDLTFSKKEVLCLQGNATAFLSQPFAQKKTTSSIFQSSLISIHLFPFALISSEILLPKSKICTYCLTRESTYVVTIMFKMKICPTKNYHMQSNTLILCLAWDELQITYLAVNLFIADGENEKKLSSPDLIVCISGGRAEGLQTKQNCYKFTRNSISHHFSFHDCFKLLPCFSPKYHIIFSI